MQEHFSGGSRCAKYTKTHPPLRLEAAWECENRQEASKLEAAIKQVPKQKKEALLTNCEDDCALISQPRCSQVLIEQINHCFCIK